jgi:hypothetical protein
LARHNSTSCAWWRRPTPSGYTFRLDAANVANPDDDYTQGPVVTFQVTPVAVKSFPWWIVAVIGGVLLIVVLAVGGYLYVSDNNARRAALAKAAEATQTAVAAAAAQATQTAVAGGASGDAAAATATARRAPRPTRPPRRRRPGDRGRVARPAADSSTILRFSGRSIAHLRGRPTASRRWRRRHSIYFLDANRFEINRYQAAPDAGLSAQHLRTVRFARNVYFSEATGAGSNGIIYQLDASGTTATPFFTVDLAQVDGYWSGDFAFDGLDNLWLASGNRIPSALYQVTGGTPVKVFTYPSDPIEGLCFETGGSLLFTNGKSALYRLTVPLYRQQLLYAFPVGETVSDVVLATP